MPAQRMHAASSDTNIPGKIRVSLLCERDARAYEGTHGRTHACARMRTACIRANRAHPMHAHAFASHASVRTARTCAHATPCIHQHIARTHFMRTTNSQPHAPARGKHQALALALALSPALGLALALPLALARVVALALSLSLARSLARGKRQANALALALSPFSCSWSCSCSCFSSCSCGCSHGT